MKRTIITSICNIGLIVLYCIILYLFFHPAVPMGYKLYYIDNLTDKIVSTNENIIYGNGFYEDEGGWRWADKNAVFVIENGDDMKNVYLAMSVSSGNDEEAEIFTLQNGKQIHSEKMVATGTDIVIEVVLQPGENVFEINTTATKVNAEDARNLYWRLLSIKCVEMS